MATPSPRGTYNRFRIEEDMWLCEEVLKANPFIREQKAEAWTTVVENLNAIPIFGKPTGERACKHRLEDIILQYRAGEMAKLRRSGTEEQFQILQELITQVVHLKEANADDDVEEKHSPAVSVTTTAKKPKPAKSSSGTKRPFLVSMAQPTEIQRRINQIQLPPTPPPQGTKKPRLLPAPAPAAQVVAPPAAVVTPVFIAAKVPHHEVTFTATPVVSASSTESSSDRHSDNYVSFLIEQISRQNDLRERELQLQREVRERELEVERERLEREERRWENQLTLLQQQQEMLRELLKQKTEQHELIVGLVKQLKGKAD
ncbi:hypothetical protein BV898_08621 [Hypsibius exemplaris]|uniref:Myb/SANT-like DNA-binding domain-containing protein n=1 Tax=Hypsibius exemplaris TaxID=2072580 RepID=A0A1W0WPZ8_HYPEX|nr:hypothetical protein BV898_08621 [Hypsibius exemplaris]